MRQQVGRLGRFLGLNRNVGLLLAAIVLIGAGEETWMRFLPKYLQALGASVFVIGLFDALKTVLGALYAYPGGIVVDRWGHRRGLVAFTLVSLVGYAVVLASPTWTAVMVGMFLFLAWSDLSLPGTFSLVAASLPAHKHAIAIGLQSLIRRLPIIIGPIVGGFLLDSFGVVSGVRAGLSLSVLLVAGAVLLQSQLREPHSDATRSPVTLRGAVRAFHPGLKRLLVSDILIRFCERIPYAWVVIYALDDVGISATQFGALIAVEMATAMACYIPASSLADRYGREPFVLLTFFFFALFPLSLIWARSFPSLAFAFVIRGLKEFGEPARKALIISFAPAPSRGQTIGAYYLIRDLVVTTGSFLGAALWKVGPGTNFWSAFALGGVGTFVYWAAFMRTDTWKRVAGSAGC
jgi:MFS family permease